MEDYITVEEVCQIFRIKERTVFRWIEKGMPSHRREEGPGNKHLFLESEVRAWFGGDRVNKDRQPIKKEKCENLT